MPSHVYFDGDRAPPPGHRSCHAVTVRFCEKDSAGAAFSRGGMAIPNREADNTRVNLVFPALASLSPRPELLHGSERFVEPSQSISCPVCGSYNVTVSNRSELFPFYNRGDHPTANAILSACLCECGRSFTKVFADDARTPECLGPELGGKIAVRDEQLLH